MKPPPTADRRAVIGEKLRQERKRQKKSQTDVAAALDTDQKVVSRAELGRTTVDTQLRIAEHLGLDLVAAN